MAIRDTGTEQLIKDTAKRIFFAEGKLNATTQDIADAAGMSRTLVNYYFRSKDILFEQVLKEGMEDMRVRLDKELMTDLPFKKKVEKFIDIFYTELTAYPYKEAFMISEINSHGWVTPPKERSIPLQNFLKEIQTAIDDGLVKKMKPVNFIINLFSLMAYPLLTRPLFKWVFDLNAPQYEKLLTERKKMIVDLLFI
ncbi:MAG TPA: TetR/AcrR family transcriptional regulator [Puia sp.]|nr:TetR/AcrR family transcriptional regulator [Puia sp.]